MLERNILSIECTVKDIDGMNRLLAKIKTKVASGVAEDWEIELDGFYVDENDYLSPPCEDAVGSWKNVGIWVKEIFQFLDDGEIIIEEESHKYGYEIAHGVLFELYNNLLRGDIIAVTGKVDKGLFRMLSDINGPPVMSYHVMDYVHCCDEKNTLEAIITDAQKRLDEIKMDKKKQQIIITIDPPILPDRAEALEDEIKVFLLGQHVEGDIHSTITNNDVAVNHKRRQEQFP